MAATQTTYSESLPIGTPGLIANSELSNIISRVLQSATCAFGMPVLQGTVDDGCVLATQETYEAASAAYAGNTGNGTMGTVTVSAGAKLGVYKLTITEPGSNIGAFEVEDPDGVLAGVGDVAAAFSAGGLAFTLADGATDFVAGDGFNITVTATSGTDVGNFLGITVRDATLGAEDDTFTLDDAIPVMTKGVIWVTAGATVGPADTVYWNPATSRYTKTATHLAIPGAKFESSAVNGGLVKLAIR